MSIYTINVQISRAGGTGTVADLLATSLRSQTSVTRELGVMGTATVEFEAEDNYTARTYALVALDAVEAAGETISTAKIHTGSRSNHFATKYDVREA